MINKMENKTTKIIITLGVIAAIAIISGTVFLLQPSTMNSLTVKAQEMQGSKIDKTLQKLEKNGFVVGRNEPLDDTELKGVKEARVTSIDETVVFIYEFKSAEEELKGLEELEDNTSVVFSVFRSNDLVFFVLKNNQDFNNQLKEGLHK